MVNGQALITRRCLKADCPKTFNCLPDSDQRYCCSDHDPNFTDKMKERRRRDSEEGRAMRAKMLVIVKAAVEEAGGPANVDRDALEIKLNAEGIRNSNGGAVNRQFLNNFMAYHGLTARRRRKKGVQTEMDVRIPSDEEIDEAFTGMKKSLAEATGIGAAARLPGVCFAILTDGELDDSEKVGLMKRYAKID